MKHLIKSSGKVQVFSSNKLQKSIIASLYAVHRNSEEAKTISSDVIQDIRHWLQNKHEVTANDIRVATATSLAKYDKDAAVVYKKHKDMW